MGILVLRTDQLAVKLTQETPYSYETLVRVIEAGRLAGHAPSVIDQVLREVGPHNLSHLLALLEAQAAERLTNLTRGANGVRMRNVKADSLPAPIEFGKNYRDRISGFEGTCTGKSQFISGCDQVLLVPPVDEKGGFREGHWFDDERLIDVETGERAERTSTRGGPQQTPSAR